MANILIRLTMTTKQPPYASNGWKSTLAAMRTRFTFDDMRQNPHEPETAARLNSGASV